MNELSHIKNSKQQNALKNVIFKITPKVFTTKL